MESSDAARQRAQAAYAIASAIAAGVVAAGLFGNIGEQPLQVQAAAILALIGWLVAAALFLHAVSSPFEIDVAPQSEEDAFVDTALCRVREERKTIDRWQRRAQIASAVAALITVMAFVVALRSDGALRSRAATLILTSAGASALHEACGDLPRAVRGDIIPSMFGADFVEVRVAADVCGPNNRSLAIRRDEVSAVVLGQ
jgi:hypothetical protein